MKKSIWLETALVLSCLLISSQIVFAGEVQSLRGMTDIEEKSKAPEVEKLVAEEKPIPRSYLQQPPLIPHDIERYQITAKYNKCLGCHSWTRYKEAGATKIPPSHFVDRNGNELANLSTRRYFCTQCHVTQTDTQPLVENEFKPLESIKEK